MDNITTKQAVEVLCEALRTDEGYRISWVANIAMAFKDECSRSGIKTPGKIHVIANAAANNFIDLLTSKSDSNEESTE